MYITSLGTCSQGVKEETKMISTQMRNAQDSKVCKDHVHPIRCAPILPYLLGEILESQLPRDYQQTNLYIG